VCVFVWLSDKKYNLTYSYIENVVALSHLDHCSMKGLNVFGRGGGM